MDQGEATTRGGRKARAKASAKPRLDEFFNLTTDLLCIADSEGRLLDLNATWERALGYRRQDLLGRKATDFVHPDDLASTEERVARLSHLEPDPFINRFRHADGSYRWLEWHSSREGDFLYCTACDITERKRADELLRESEARWRQLFEDMPDALLLLDDTSGIPVIADCNTVLCTVTGYSRDELIGQPIMKLRPPEVTEDDVRRRTRRVRDAGHIAFEIEYQRKDGTRYPVEAAVSAIRIDGTDMSLVVERDISARKAAEKALLESEKRFAEFMDRVPALCFIKDADSRLVYINRQFRDSHDAGDWLGKTNSDLWPPEEAARLSRVDELVRTVGEQIRIEEDLPVGSDTRSFLTVKFPMRGPDDERLVGAVSIDVTEQRKAERTLRDSEARWKAIFDGSPDGMLLLDESDGLPIIAACNPAICATSGYTREELVGQTVLRLTSARVREEEVRDHFEIVRRTGTIGFETEHRRKDGSTFPVEIAGSRVHLDGREMILTVERDISARRAAEDALREQDRILRDAQKVARVGSWHWNAATDTITWSDEYHSIIGHDPALPPPGYDEHLGWYAPESAARLDAVVQEAIATGNPYEVDLDLIRPDGVHLAVVARGEAVRDSSGQVVALRGTLQDITERKQMEAALAESQRRLSLHMERTPVAAIEWDTDLRATSWNPAAEQIFGYTAREAIGQHASIILPEAARPAVDGIFASLLSREGGDHGVNENVTKDGSVLVCEWFNTLLTDADGRVVGVASLVQDVTQRVATEQALRESEERFRAAIEAIPIAVVGFDGERLVLANEAATTLSGYSREEILLPGFVERIFDDEARSSLLARGSARLRGEPAKTGYEFRLARRDGQWRTVEANVSVVRLGGRPVSIIAATDITDRRQAEESLRMSEERHRALVEASPSAMVVHRAGEVLFANDALARLLRVDDPMTLRGANVEDFTHPDDRDLIRKRVAEMAYGTTRQLPAIEERLLRSDGEAFPAEVIAVTAMFDGEPATIVVVSDLSERKRHEQQLRALNEELEERVAQRTAALAEAKERAEAADQAKSALLSRASHELRTPLNSILGFAQILALDELPPDQEESVDHILAGGQHLLGLVDEVLDLARIETGRIALSIESTDLDLAVREALRIVAPMATERGIVTEWQGSTGPRVLADPQRLKQVLLNLLSNAIKYNRENGTVSLHADLSDGRTLRMSVTDTGMGIAPEKLGLLFNPFERLGAEATSVQGTGLGLTLSLALTEAMGGTIGVTSRPGYGSTFWIDLPLATGPDQPDKVVAPDPAPPFLPTAPASARRVLYIEDNLENLRLVESLLRRWKDVTLVPAMQGSVGLDLAVERIDLVVLDVHLPDLPGEEVLRQLKANPATRDIPVIVASADATPQQIERMMNAGAAHYFIKPLNVRQFLVALSDVLGEAGTDHLSQ